MLVIVIDGFVVVGKGMFLWWIVEVYGFYYFDMGFIYWVCVKVLLDVGLLLDDEC